MATTFTNLVSRIQIDFPDASATELLDDLQVIHNELCFRFKLIKSTQSNTSLVAGTGSYALPTNTARIYQVRYWADSSGFTVLTETSEDEMDSVRPRWRGETAGTPRFYMADSGTMTLVPAPGISTSGGYPKLTFEISSYQPAISGSDTLPTGIFDHEAWVNGVKARFALRHGDARYPVYERMYEESRAILAQQTNTVPARFQPRFQPAGLGTGLGKV